MTTGTHDYREMFQGKYVVEEQVKSIGSRSWLGGTTTLWLYRVSYLLGGLFPPKFWYSKKALFLYL